MGVVPEAVSAASHLSCCPAISKGSEHLRRNAQSSLCPSGLQKGIPCTWVRPHAPDWAPFELLFSDQLLFSAPREALSGGPGRMVGGSVQKGSETWLPGFYPAHVQMWKRWLFLLSLTRGRFTLALPFCYEWVHSWASSLLRTARHFLMRLCVLRILNERYHFVAYLLFLVKLKSMVSDNFFLKFKSESKTPLMCYSSTKCFPFSFHWFPPSPPI